MLENAHRRSSTRSSTCSPKNISSNTLDMTKLAETLREILGKKQNVTKENVEKETPQMQTQMQMHTEVHEIRREIREKKASIAVLQTHYEQLAVQFRAEKERQKKAAYTIEELKKKLQQSQQREREAQRIAQRMDDAEIQMEQLHAIISDLRADKAAIETRVKVLQENSVHGDALEQKRYKRMETQFHEQMEKMKADLIAKEQHMEEFRKELKDTVTHLQKQAKLVETLSLQKQEFQTQTEKMLRENADLSKRLAAFASVSGSTPEDIEKALEIVRRTKSDPSRVVVLAAGEIAEKSEDELTAAKAAKYELKIKELTFELQKRQDVLSTHVQLYRDQKRSSEQYQQQIAELKLEIEKLQYELDRRPVLSNDVMAESMFEMSTAGNNELEEANNLLAFRITHCSLNRVVGELDEDSITFIAVEHFDFEPVYSQLRGGLEPDYQFTAQFQVMCDNFYIKHLQTDCLNVSLYAHRSEGSVMLGRCSISLRGLLGPHGAIESTIQIYSQNNSLSGVNSVIGTLEYIVRLRRPVVNLPPSRIGSEPRTPLLQPAANVLQPVNSGAQADIDHTQIEKSFIDASSASSFIANPHAETLPSLPTDNDDAVPFSSDPSLVLRAPVVQPIDASSSLPFNIETRSNTEIMPHMTGSFDVHEEKGVL